eukprot:Gb_18147 [translate_table: standard]
MWNEQQQRRSIPPCGQRISKSAPCSPIKPIVKKGPIHRSDSFHVIHKVPLGDTPYVKAKHVQLVDKDPDRAIALFWAAINAGDRVDSALKDMAIVMKQQNRPEEAIEAIKSLRNRCSDQAQESLDNVLLDLYKRCGRLDDQIALLKHKLNLIHQGMAFNGKRTKTARSQGKKFQVSIEQEATRLLGNLGWAYMQQNNYIAAEAVYRKALTIEPDNNKMCNLGICLMKQGRVAEAKAMLQCVKPASADGPWGLDSHLKSYERAQEMLKELESQSACSNIFNENPESEALKSSVWQPQPCCPRQPSTRKQQNHKPVPDTVGNGSTTYLATAGFGPLQQQKLLLVPPEAPTSQFSMFSTNGYWEEKRDNNDAFGDENVNVNINMNGPPVQSLPPLGAGYQMQRHAETLRQKLEQVCLKENGNPSKPTFPPPIANNTERILNSAAPPFFCRNTQGNEQRMPLTLDRTNDQKIMPFAEQNKFVLGNGKDNHPKAHNKNRPTSRRSLSFESVDEGLDLLLHQPQPTHNNKTLTKCNSISLPLQDKADPWPDNEEFENAILAALCESNPSSHDDKVQRRLRVFQEMTLSSPIA